MTEVEGNREEGEGGGLELLRGAEAIGLAALMSGVEAYFGYPITPSSEIMEFMASEQGDPRFPRYRAFVQASSEVEAVNMLMGAGAVGHLAMTATSGPGLSLMAEGISYSVGTELPFLIVDVNRGGPGLGNVEPEQSDYAFVTRSLGHGGSRAIVLAPQGVEEAMEHVNRGFRLAFEYRIPVVILTDAIIVHMRETIRIPAIEEVRPRELEWTARGRIGGARHLLTSMYLEPHEMRSHKEALMNKWRRIETEVRDFECIMCDDADTLLIAYGVAARKARGAVADRRKRGMRLGLFRPVTLNPFPWEELESAAEGREVVVVEMSEGQLYEDVSARLGPLVKSIAVPGGEIVDVEEALA
ncbi:MAG: 3-methyl-2-oxobutanoate dehydrogenase subunit beta [Conexivisphaera sp.]|jgi:pyruvate/2-oxoacid:ferredoxin oxidoreductase alpha subunit